MGSAAPPHAAHPAVSPAHPFAAFFDLRALRAGDLPRDLAAAGAVTLLTLPQAVAYALMAGLPPSAGLFAAALPASVGSFFRSSRFVVAGPTNALSLLVGGSVAVVAAQSGAPPLAVAGTLALLTGLMQAAAGVLRLGGVVDYLSAPVVLGYITGAAALIALDQLPNLTGTPMLGHDVAGRLWSWFQGSGQVHPLSLALAAGTTAAVVLLRRLDPRIPGPLLVMGGGIGASVALDLPRRGVRVVADLGSVVPQLPPWTVPDLSLVSLLLPAAVAATVLSLVESAAVARSLAERTHEPLDSDAEFLGQGLANVTAAFFGGYPTSGSPSRSLLNWSAGSRSRLSGVFAGLMVVAVVLFLGPAVDHTPIPCLAGLLLVLAWDLLDGPRLKLVLRAGPGDVAALVATLAGTFLLDLDKAIVLGVGISIALFLRRVRNLSVVELAVDEAGRLQESRALDGAADDEGEEHPTPPDPRAPVLAHCRAIRVLHAEGNLFFGAATELRRVLDGVIAEPEARVLVLRLKRCQGIDVTTADVLKAAAARLRAQGRHLVLVGMRDRVTRRMVALQVHSAVGPENLFPTEAHWFAAMDRALAHARTLVGPHEPECPVERYLRTRGMDPAPGATGT